MTVDEARVYTIAKWRARQFGISVAQVNHGAIIGAYFCKPWNLVEFCMHEASHLVTLGHHPSDFPRIRRNNKHSLMQEVSRRFENIGPQAGNCLEIDASLVAFHAGKSLGFWTDSTDIVDSCWKNLTGANAGLEGLEKVRERFREDPTRQMEWQSKAIAEWFMHGSKP
jgi:hypothetical protein